MIMAKNVLVCDVPVEKPGEMVPEDAPIRLREPELRYVSRGALKLIGALDHFQISVRDKIAIDVGASTGGFTEVLLERGLPLFTQLMSEPISWPGGFARTPGW